MKYLLDTNICVFYLKKKFRLFDKVDSIGPENCYISVVTISEILLGIEFSAEPDSNRNDIKTIEEKFGIVTLYDALPLFAKEKVRLTRSGQIIPDPDIYIGVTSVTHGMTMVTQNTKHFKRLEGIELEDWTKAKHNEFIQ